MLKKYLDIKKLRVAYVGDSVWLEELEKQVAQIETEDVEEQDVLYDVKELLYLLWKMNDIVVTTETEEFASEFNGQTQELYSRMKIKLTEMLGISDFWEML